MIFEKVRKIICEQFDLDEENVTADNSKSKYPTRKLKTSKPSATL